MEIVLTLAINLLISIDPSYVNKIVIKMCPGTERFKKLHRIMGKIKYCDFEGI